MYAETKKTKIDDYNKAKADWAKMKKADREATYKEWMDS